MSNLEILKKNQIFENLTDDELKIIESICNIENYAENEIIFEEGAKSEDFYILIKGKVAIEIQLQMKSEKASVHTVDEGQVFGEFALIDHEPRSATATTIKDSTLLRISIDEFMKKLDEYPAIGYKVMKNFNKILSTRIKKTTKELRASLLWN
ncbi:MAG TPA: cyclic nucleotide-binding domain-containing protein [bacterium]|nr:cyclic nucleotide-binding domain-containing protein [bacterium]HOL48144.1 cyclic nucleotide-binding domain-containing protein [bacterium]HPQ18500.1 cyclic nucleotide-binding domain-containing protein [bacterium]